MRQAMDRWMDGWMGEWMEIRTIVDTRMKKYQYHSNE